jgi:hypothetical protein
VPTPANLGDVMKVSDMVIEKVTAKANTAIEKGMLVCSDGTGTLGVYVPATAALSQTHRVCVARENVSADAENRDFMVLVKGLIVAKKNNQNAIQAGLKVKVDVAAGDALAMMSTDNANYYVGYAHKDAAATDTKFWLRIQ